MSFRIGGMIWTACGAGWLVIYFVTGVWQSLLVGLGCVCLSYAFHKIGEDLGEP